MICPCKGNITGDEPTGAVSIYPPRETQVNRMNNGLSPKVAVDSCMRGEIAKLWSHNIITTGCCCGHGIPDCPAFISVKEPYIEEMENLGYEHVINPFYPQSKLYFKPFTDPVKLGIL